MSEWNDFLEALDDDPFEEYPVGVREFVEGKDFLGHPPLSDIQYTAVECMSQIYQEVDLARFMGAREAYDHYRKYTKSEVILELGKGCHHGDTPVYSPETGGWIPIKEHTGMVESKGARYASESFVEGVDKLYKVTFNNHMSEIVSGDHKYLAAPHTRRVAGLDKYKFMPVSELSANARVAWNRNYTVIDPVNISEQEVEALALCSMNYVAGDGVVNFKVHYSRKHVREYLVDTYGGVATQETATISNVAVEDEALLGTMKRLGMFAEHEAKRLPPELFKSDNSTILAYLQKMYKYAGYVGHRTSNRHGYQLANLPVALAQDICHAIMRVGLLPYITIKEDVFLYGPNRIQWKISVDSYPHNELMAQALGEKHEWRNAAEKPHGKTAIITDDYFLMPIKRIEPVESGEYWTKTVPDTGWYVGNGPVSENSGKDLLSTIAVSYVVYKLLCLKDPSAYYGKPSGDAIDIINIAINAQQARNVFFKGLKNKISRSPWFVGKYSDTQESIAFDKSVTAYSGHSERESHEGLNLIMAVLDEISGFGEGTALNESGKSAKNIYDAFRASVDSRFPGGIGCVALLSFPRHSKDFITQKYDEAVATKEVVKRRHTFVINENLPPIDGNTFTIEWDEDHVQSYVLPDIWAIKRPSWDVNPTRDINDYKNSFFLNKSDALQRFACMPSEISSDAFFRDVDKIELAMAIRNPVSKDRIIDHNWRPDPNVTYYVHADLAQKVDKCAVAVAHVDKWVGVDVGRGTKETFPYVVVDMVAWWEPKVEGPVDLSEVKRWIIDLKAKHRLDVGFVSFDRWGSFDLIRELKDRGFKSDTLSVGKDHYTDFAMMLYEERVLLPRSDLLLDELTALKVIKKRVDHPRKSSKDLADAVTGAIYNAISRTPRKSDQTIKVHAWSPSRDRDDDTPVPYTDDERKAAKAWLAGLDML